MKSSRPDLASILGIVVASVAIVGGLLLEGGALADIAQPTAAVIVLGGTIGAVMVNTPGGILLGAVRSLRTVFSEQALSANQLLEEIVIYASRARRNGLVSLEADAEKIQDPFLRKAMNLAVDGTDIQELRRILELEIELEHHHAEQIARVFESAGGYAPTIGIIGAVMGLIQVMKRLSDIEQVGHGIAIAFVATIYGVAVANIVFLPIANKIKARAQKEMAIREMMVEGVVGIVEGLNPKLIRSKLESFGKHDGAGKAQATAAPASRPEAA